MSPTLHLEPEAMAPSRSGRHRAAAADGSAVELAAERADDVDALAAAAQAAKEHGWQLEARLLKLGRRKKGSEFMMLMLQSTQELQRKITDEKDDKDMVAGVEVVRTGIPSFEVYSRDSEAGTCGPEEPERPGTCGPEEPEHIGKIIHQPGGLGEKETILRNLEPPTEKWGRWKTEASDSGVAEHNPSVLMHGLNKLSRKSS
eukprot:s3094_g10.t1